MSVIEEVRRDREDLARVLKKHVGIRKIVEDLYPDSAHFIYELLQNAEDTGASETRFVLSDEALVFEHNGRAFEPNDIYAITDIGEGTKADDDEKIGRFGVGFKAVFAYSETPHIWSHTFSFRIADLVLPFEITPKSNLDSWTRFEFPFNNPQKSPEAAFGEVEEGLSGLAETALLFLNNIEAISWRIGSSETGEILRIKHSENHYEVLKQMEGKTITGAHFLKFDRSVQGLEKQKLSVAFALDFRSDVTEFNPRRALAKQLKIVPARPGQVAVFFPAEKESSGLRFHLHAPFIPELSRASIKETPANKPLFQQLAALTAASLHQIRDLGLLNAEFLAVLPNPQDQISPRYLEFREAIVCAMNDESLTPTYTKSHAPAKHLLQAKASLKELLSEDDLALLLDSEDEAPRWAVGAAHKNSNVDKFLDSLEIVEWDFDEFINFAFIYPEEFREFLSSKSVEWHQKLYSLLYTDADITLRTESLEIVFLNDDTYKIGKECFFPSPGGEHNNYFPYVKEGVYTSGKSDLQKENSRKFLEAVGVREVDEIERVKMVLEQRYAQESDVPEDDVYQQDMMRFIALVEKEPSSTQIFSSYWIFLGSDDLWRRPDQVFLDEPYMDTGLTALYLTEHASRAALGESYQNWSIETRKLIKFAEDVGVQTRLEITQTTCYGNRNYHTLVSSAPGGWSDRYGLNRDFKIEQLDVLLERGDKTSSRLIWKTVCDKKDSEWLWAQYRSNSKYPINRAPSKIVCLLKEAQWVPQTDGRFVRPAEASSGLLPKGFPFDAGWRWLEAVNFGKEIAKKSEEQLRKQSAAKELGFPDSEALEDGQWFAKLSPEQRQQMKNEMEKSWSTELPEDEPSNPERRAERVGEQASAAPGRESETRTRSVSTNREAVKKEAEQYLRQRYTNAEEEMICQVCKAPLPFKLNNGSSYFEKVEFLTGLHKRHHQNYLALCPNHAAMFQHANGSEDLMLEMFKDMSGYELEVVLAQQNTTIYFTKTHAVDIKAVIVVDEATNEYEPED